MTPVMYRAASPQHFDSLSSHQLLIVIKSLPEHSDQLKHAAFQTYHLPYHLGITQYISQN